MLLYWLLRRDGEAESQTCAYAPSGKREAAARVLNIVKGNTLGVDDCDCHGKGKACRDENGKGYPLDQVHATFSMV